MGTVASWRTSPAPFKGTVAALFLLGAAPRMAETTNFLKEIGNWKLMNDGILKY